MNASLPLSTRRAVRALANSPRNNVKVIVVDSDAAPTVKGESFYFTTPGGNRVWYPNAYRRAWGKPVYHASTLRVEVGAQFLATM